MEKLTVAGREALLFPAAREDVPLVLLHAAGDEGETVYRKTREATERDFSFAAVGGLNWERDMSPWPCPPLFKGGAPFSGGADAYLGELTGKILPEILARLPKPAYISIAGYSLAGLFAVYALYGTDCFSRAASASGSFWYPGFLEFAAANGTAKKPERVYFSLGDREAGTRNKLLGAVEENTRALKERYEKAGVETVFELNPGNHFRDAEARMARGIVWMLGETSGAMDWHSETKGC